MFFWRDETLTTVKLIHTGKELEYCAEDQMKKLSEELGTSVNHSLALIMNPFSTNSVSGRFFSVGPPRPIKNLPSSSAPVIF